MNACFFSPFDDPRLWLWGVAVKGEGTLMVGCNEDKEREENESLLGKTKLDDFFSNPVWKASLTD